MARCAAIPESNGLIGSMTHFIDCGAERLATSAYQVLAAPGSILSILLTGFLTIFIALIGYRLLLGERFDLRTGTLAMVKIGAVLALATSWPAYQIVVYDVVTKAPSEIVEQIGRPSGLPGSSGSLVGRLDRVDGALAQLSIVGAGHVVPGPLDPRIAPPPFNGFHDFALGGSRILFVISAVAGIAAVNLIAALMLALGPFFVAFLLFENTRSLFEGWVRVLTGTIIAAIGISVILGFELAYLEPWLADVLSRRASGQALPTVPTDLVILTTLFALLVVAVLISSARLATAFRLAPLRRLVAVEREAAVSVPVAAHDQGTSRSPPQQEERSRAAAVADVLVSLQRREGTGGERTIGSRVLVTGQASTATGGGGPGTSGVGLPLGQSFRRRARNRVSASADRRDRS
jgi:type IV secretion system protein VirB6